MFTPYWVHTSVDLFPYEMLRQLTPYSTIYVFCGARFVIITRVRISDALLFSIVRNSTARDLAGI